MGAVRNLNVILMLLGALSVLLLGVLPSSAMTSEAPAPCHEAASSTPSEHEAPAPSGKAMAAMACCVSWVVTPSLQGPSRGLVACPATPLAPAAASLPIGLSPAPEHGPPRI